MSKPKSLLINHYARGMTKPEYAKWYWKNNKPRLDKLRKKYAKEGRYKQVHKKLALKYNYGLSLEKFNELKIKQNNRCAICKEIKTLCVDHCHKTLKIRGLLCHRCNLTLGMIHEDLNLIIEFKNYIETHA